MSTSAGQPPPALPRGWPAALLLAVLLAWLGSATGRFQFDDFGAIVDNPKVHDFPAWLHSVGSGSPRPLLTLSYLVCWLAGHGDEWPFHVFNLLLHLLNCVLVVVLANRLLIHAAGPATSRPATALLAGALFAVHPAHSEAITYISGRSTALMTAFYLLALWQHDRAGTATRAGEAARHRAGALLCWLAGVMSKEIALILPLAVWLWDALTGVPPRLWWRRQRLLWLSSLALVAGLLCHPGYRHLLLRSLQLRDLASQFDVQARATVALLFTLLHPWSLDFDPDWHPGGISAAGMLAWVLLLAAMAASWRWRRRPLLAMALAWPLLHLLVPHLLMARDDVANERQLYWADWPLMLAAAALLRRSAAHRRMVPAMAGLLLALSVLAERRNLQYADPVLLWQDAVAHAPGKARTWNNLGYALALAGRDQEARLAYREALARDPTLVRARNNLERLAPLPP